MKLIEGTSRIPLYHQVVDILKLRIQDGTYAVGDKLPSEQEFTNEFGISRITIRKAISELISEGLVYSVRGKGTFVAEARIKRTLGKLLGFVEELELDGIKPELKVIKYGFETPNPYMIETLGMDVSEKIFMLQRLVSVKGEPLFVDYAWYPETYSRFLVTSDLSKSVHYHVMELAGIKLSHAIQEISAGTPSRVEAALLNIKRNATVLLINRMTFSNSKMPFSLGKAVYRADRYSYKVDLTR